MSDCEELDFLWESVTFPGKVKKESKGKCKNDTTMKTDGMPKKKRKKNSKSKGAVINKKEKKKDKKKNKNKLVSDRLDGIVFTQASVPLAKPVVNPETSCAPSNEKPQPDLLTQGGKPKRKKKVAFDLLPGYSRATRPKFVSSSPVCPKKSILFKNEEVGDSEICSQVTVTRHNQWPRTQETQENDSQCNSEDINSQDLFITQKTFRVPSPESSSGEASDKTSAAIPQFTQQSMFRYSQALTHSCSGDSRVYKTAWKPKEVSPVEEELHRIHRKEKNRKILHQTQMTTGPNIPEERKSLSPVYKISSLSPSMAVIPPSLDAEKSKKQLSQQSMTSASTQTENFFTAELSSYLDFCQKHRANSNTEELKPLDLSLPQRARRNLCPSMIMPFLPGQVQEGDHKDAHLHPSSSPGVKEGQEEIGVPGHKSETTPSPQFESKPKSADMTTSSEDEPPSRPGKLDLTQVSVT